MTHPHSQNSRDDHPETPPDPDLNAFVHFLQQHRPAPPPAAADLEDQILALAQAHPHGASRMRSPWQSVWQRWWLPILIATGALVGWSSQRWFLQAPVTAAELAEMQTFVQDSWQGAIAVSSESDSEFGPVLVTDTQ